MKIAVINGPNLNMLSYRDSSIYGNQTIKNINQMLEDKYPNILFEFITTNFEGEIIEKIHESIVNNYDGIIINPGGLSHYSISIMDALEMFEGQKVEVHLSDVYNREEFRKNLITARSCDNVISGKGSRGYFEAMEYIIKRNEL